MDCEAKSDGEVLRGFEHSIDVLVCRFSLAVIFLAWDWCLWLHSVGVQLLLGMKLGWFT